MKKNILKKYALLIAKASLVSLISTANATGNYPCDAASDPFFCYAPVGSSAGGVVKHTDNLIYSGLVWEFFVDNGYIPEFVIGFRSLQIKDNVNGADANFRIKYKDKISPDSLRLSYVSGSRDIMGNFGGGYSFTYNSWLATAAIQGPYTRLSTDYILNESKLRFYGELNTIGKPSMVFRPAGDGTCPSYNYWGNRFRTGDLTTVNNGILDNNYNLNTFNVDPNEVVNGKTCFINTD